MCKCVCVRVCFKEGNCLLFFSFFLKDTTSYKHRVELRLLTQVKVVCFDFERSSSSAFISLHLCEALLSLLVRLVWSLRIQAGVDSSDHSAAQIALRRAALSGSVVRTDSSHKL